MTHTLAAVFESRADAAYARDALVSAGFDSNAIQLNDATSATGAGQQFDTGAAPGAADETLVDSIRHFFSRLFGGEHRDHRLYAEAIRRGHVVLTVRAPSHDQAERAAIIVQNFGPLDMERPRGREGADQWLAGGAAPAGAAMQRSGMGSQQGGPPPRDTASSASGGGAQMGTVQSGASAGGAASQRGAASSDSMQRAEPPAAMPQGPGAPGAAADAQQGAGARIYPTPNQGSLNIQRGDALGVSEDTYFHAHWLDTYSYIGGTYQEYDPAYRYGASMANKTTYQGSAWEDVEPHLRSDWENRHPESHWEKFKEAVRAGWERMTG
ncbi:MAG TPA: hypothetical protein VFT05_07255 [Burkholderiaceae bacterium]|nr:hypothetical protein [Burkholderiaceae bacterium]